MTVEDTANEYLQLIRAKSSWGSSNERAIVYLAHAINQQNGLLTMLIKEIREERKNDRRRNME